MLQVIDKKELLREVNIKLEDVALEDLEELEEVEEKVIKEEALKLEVDMNKIKKKEEGVKKAKTDLE